MSAEPFGICWSCQGKLSRRRTVWLSEQLPLPCCLECWGKISEGRRLEIAQKFFDRSESGLGVQETLSIIRDLISQSIAGYFHKFDDPRGRLN